MCEKRAMNKIAINGSHLFARFYVRYYFGAFNFVAKHCFHVYNEKINNCHQTTVRLLCAGDGSPAHHNIMKMV